MEDNDMKIAKELKLRLQKVASLVDFRIFGSRATGNAGEYSDLDVFIEVEKLDKSLKQEIKDICWEVGFDNLIHISPLIFSRYEIEQSPLRISPIVKNIFENGIVA